MLDDLETFASLGLAPGFQELLDRRLAASRREASQELEQSVERRMQECAHVLHTQLLRAHTALQKKLAANFEAVEGAQRAQAAEAEGFRNELQRAITSFSQQVLDAKMCLHDHVEVTKSSLSSDLFESREAARKLEHELANLRQELRSEFVELVADAQQCNSARWKELSSRFENGCEQIINKADEALEIHNRDVSESMRTLAWEQQECKVQCGRGRDEMNGLELLVHAGFAEEKQRARDVTEQITSEAACIRRDANSELQSLQGALHAFRDQYDFSWSARSQHMAESLQHFESEFQSMKGALHAFRDQCSNSWSAKSQHVVDSLQHVELLLSRNTDATRNSMRRLSDVESVSTELNMQILEAKNVLLTLESRQTSSANVQQELIELQRQNSSTLARVQRECQDEISRLTVNGSVQQELLDFQRNNKAALASAHRECQDEIRTMEQFTEALVSSLGSRCSAEHGVTEMRCLKAELQDRSDHQSSLALRLQALESEMRACGERQADLRAFSQELQAGVKHVELEGPKVCEEFRYDFDAQLANMSSRLYDMRDVSEQHIRAYISSAHSTLEEQQHRTAGQIDCLDRRLKSVHEDITSNYETLQSKHLRDQHKLFEQCEDFCAEQVRQEVTRAASGLIGNMVASMNGLAAEVETVSCLDQQLSDIKLDFGQQLQDMHSTLEIEGAEWQQVRAVADKAARRADEAAFQSVALQAELAATELSIESDLKRALRELHVDFSEQIRTEFSTEIRDATLAARKIDTYGVAIANTNEKIRAMHLQIEEHKTVEDRLDELSQTVRVIQSWTENKALDDRVNHVSKSVCTIETNQEVIEKRLDELCKSIRCMESQSQASKTAFDDRMCHIAKSVCTYESKQEGISHRVEDLGKHIYGMELQIAQHSQKNCLSEKVTAIGSELSQQATKLEHFSGKLSSMESRIVDIESQLSQQAIKLDNDSGKLSSVEFRVADTESQLSQQAIQIENVNGKLPSVESHITDIEKTQHKFRTLEGNLLQLERSRSAEQRALELRVEDLGRTMSHLMLRYERAEPAPKLPVATQTVSVTNGEMGNIVEQPFEASFWDELCHLKERLATTEEQLLFLRADIAPDAICGILERGGFLRKLAEETAAEELDRFRRRWCTDFEWHLDCLAQCLQTLHTTAGLHTPSTLLALQQRRRQH